METSAWSPPAPDDVIAAGDAAESLGLARSQAPRLTASGLLGPLVRTPSGAHLARTANVERLAGRAERSADDLPAGIIVRTVGAEPVQEPDREWLGFHVTMPDALVQTAALRWWLVRDAEALVGEHIVVSVATYPTWVGRITNVQRAPSGRVGFSATLDGRITENGSISTSATPDARLFLTSRLALPRGSRVDRIRV